METAGALSNQETLQPGDPPTRALPKRGTLLKDATTVALLRSLLGPPFLPPMFSSPPPTERQISLREARNQLARLVDAVHQGASVVLTKHGRPWVRLVPLAASGASHRRAGRCAGSSPGLDPTALFAARDRLTVHRLLQRQQRR